MGKYLNSPKPTFPCGVCGEQLRSGSKVCHACRADDRTGLHGEGAVHDPLDLPDDSAEFDHAEFMKREFGVSPKPHGMRWIWWFTAVLLIAAFALSYLWFYII